MNGTANRTSAWLNFAQRSRDEGGLGLAPHQAAGLVGNLVNESGQDLNPWGPTGDNGTAWGTAQWRGDRLSGLRNHASANGMDYRSMEAQQAWMRQELDSTESKAYRALQAAQTPEQAAHAFDALYERSDGATRSKRMQSARSLMEQFGGGAPADDTASPALSYAATTERKPSMPSPALSADGAIGPGVLSDVEASGPQYDRVASALTGMGAALAGISNPDQAKALIAQQASMQKQAVDPGTWGVHTLPDGTSFYFNNKTRQTIPIPGKFVKPQEDPYVETAKKEEAKAISKQGNDIHEAANAAASMAPDIATLERVINTPGVEQGILGPARNTLNKIYTTFGFGDPKAASDADLLSSIGSKTALQIAQNGGTKILPGSFSNSDRDLVLKMGNGEGLTHDANVQLLQAMKIHNKRLEEVDAIRQEHSDRNGGYLTPSFRKDLAQLRSKWNEENKARDEANASRAKPAATAAKPALAIDHSAIDAELKRRGLR